MTAKTLEQRVYDGAKAREVLENEAFAQAFEDIRQEYTKAWMKSPEHDAQGREHHYQMLKLTEKLKEKLEAALSDGKMASLTLEHQAQQQARERAEGVNVNGWQS
jgi:uncharacterized protein YkwD